MRKSLLTPLALAVVSTLALSGCGQSVEDARADAYATVSAMDGLSESELDDYTAQIDTAADKTAIDRIVAEAQAQNDQRLASRATASAEADQAEVLEAQLAGLTLTGTSSECEGKTLTLNADGTWSGDAADAECLGFGGSSATTWTIKRNEWDGGVVFLATNDAESLVYAWYSVTIVDGTVTFVQADGYDVGVPGYHVFSSASSVG